MRIKGLLSVIAAAAVLAGAGCSSSSGKGAGSSGGHGGRTITIGVLTDATGLAASAGRTCVDGVRAGTVVASGQGYTIKYDVGDTTSSPSGALSAAQKLVEQDQVTAVLTCSSLTFGAANYLTARGMPVIGPAEDGPEWLTSKNMFAVFGTVDQTKVATTIGQFFKMEGATNVGAVGYGVSPQSADAAKSAAASVKHAGLKVGYLNANFPFGSTNVQPIAVAMNNAHVDGTYAVVEPNSGFALITALRQLGSHVKVNLLPTGYGGDLTQGGPGALQAAQGVYFQSLYQPVEMHTAATQQFQRALRAAGVTTAPTYAQYVGYTSVAMLVDALKAAGPTITSTSLMAALNGLRGFNAWGLLGNHNFAPSDRASTSAGVGGCFYVTKLQGSSFQLVANADPICGSVIPGETVSSSS